MYVAVRHDAQQAVGPFLSEIKAIEWARDRRVTSDERFYVRPLMENWL